MIFRGFWPKSQNRKWLFFQFSRRKLWYVPTLWRAKIQNPHVSIYMNKRSKIKKLEFQWDKKIGAKWLNIDSKTLYEHFNKISTALSTTTGTKSETTTGTSTGTTMVTS